MAIDPKHMLAVGGIAAVALGAGFGIARVTGGKDAPPPARPAARAELPSVAAGSSVRIAQLDDVAALPARQARTSSGKTTPAPSATAAPNPTAAPPVATSAPVTPTQAPSTPEPARTPAVGGGTGGE